MNALLRPGLDPGRLGRITGSRAPGVLGISPYTTRAKVLREMVRQFAGAESEFTGNVATRHGLDNEAGAIALYAAQSFDAVHGEQAFIVHPDHDYLAVTVDGLVGRDGMIEVKCPYRAVYSAAAERPDYLAQMQLQMACAGRQWCDFVVMIDDAITVDRVALDPDWLPSVLPEFAYFMEQYADAISHPDNVAEYCTDAPAVKAQLISLDTLTPVEIFTGPKLDEILAQIRAETASLVPNVASVTGRKEVASLAYKVARSKAAIDDAGKELVAGWKKQAAVVDSSRKKARDYLDALRDEVRAPLDEWEAAEARKEQEAAEAARLILEVEEAAKAAELERREAELAEREAKLAAAEKAKADRLADIEAARIRAERDESIRAESEAAAAATIAKAKQDAIDAAIRAEAAQAEAVRQAEARAVAMAVDAERDRLAAIAKQEADDAKRAANKRHCKAIDGAAMAAFTAAGIPHDIAAQIVNLIASGVVPAVSISY